MAVPQAKNIWVADRIVPEEKLIVPTSELFLKDCPIMHIRG